MRQAICHCLLILGLLATPEVWGQSTISDLPLEVTTSHGLWAALLPDYELGSKNSGGPAFRDNLDDVGYMGRLKAVRRFLGTRTSFEVEGFYAYAESSSKTGVTDIDVPNPSTGASSLFAGGRSRLSSNVDHYGYDIALRDTWRTGLGGLSAGCGFSYMAFDQDFDADYGAMQLLRERLDTRFCGLKTFVGWDGRLYSRPTNLDLAIGAYDIDAEYQFIGQAIPGVLASELSRTVATVEATLKTRTFFRGYQFGLSFGVMYISDMPKIERIAAMPASLGSDAAVTLNGLLEILL